MAEGPSLFDKLGGKTTLDKVHKDFYDAIYEDPELKFYFKDVEQELIEKTQTLFMMSKFGGPGLYQGLGPVDAHRHMYIQMEHLEKRNLHLKNALDKNKVPLDLQERWLAIDHAFWDRIAKKDFSELERRYKHQEYLIPPKYALAASKIKLPEFKAPTNSSWVL